MIRHVLVTTVGISALLGSPRPVDAQTTQGWADCMSCREQWDEYNMWHDFPIWGQIEVDPRTGHGPHAGWASGWCAGSHGGCYVFDQEQLEELAALDSAPAVLTYLSEYGGRATIDLERGRILLLTCNGHEVVAEVFLRPTATDQLAAAWLPGL